MKNGNFRIKVCDAKIDKFLDQNPQRVDFVDLTQNFLSPRLLGILNYVNFGLFHVPGKFFQISKFYNFGQKYRR